MFMTDAKRSMQAAIQKNKEERLTNLRIMLKKGKITQEEYDKKILQ